MGHPPKLGHIGQLVNATGFAYATCCTLQPLVARQFRGRGFGIESTADVLLAKPPTRTSGASYFHGICREKGETTSGLEPLTCSLRVIGQVLQRLARGCKSRISRRLSLLRFAACCTVLLLPVVSEWYQSRDAFGGFCHRRQHGQGVGLATALSGERRSYEENVRGPLPVYRGSGAFTILYIDPTLQHVGVGHRL